MTTTAYSYIRFSTTEQLYGDSLRRQMEGTEKACKDHGWTLDKSTYRDLGVSGFHGANSESGRLGAFLEAAQKGTVKRGSVLVVECLDRISRQAARKAIKVVEAIVDAGVSVFSLYENQLITPKSIDDIGSRLKSLRATAVTRLPVFGISVIRVARHIRNP